MSIEEAVVLKQVAPSSTNDNLEDTKDEGGRFTKSAASPIILDNSATLPYSDIICLKCGACCHWIKNGKIVKCSYLLKTSDGKTKCKIYHNRLGTPLGKEIKCGYRKDAPFNFPGCSYNHLFPEKPMFPKML